MTLPASNIVPLPKPKQKSLWTKTPYANLYRYEPNGKYYVKAKIGGYQFKKCLKTRSKEIAIKKLASALEGQRKLRGADCDSMTVQALADEWTRRLKADSSLKPRSKEYRRETLDQLWATWPELESQELQTISGDDFQRWARKARARYSPVRFNGTLGTLRQLVKLAMDKGLLHEDPTARVERAAVIAKEPQMPTDEQFRQLIDCLAEKTKNGYWVRKSPAALLTVRFLAFSGMRIGAARLVMPSDVDIKHRRIKIPAIKHQKSALWLPMSRPLVKAVKELLANHPGDNSPLLPIKDPRKALQTCCRKIGMARMTNHHWRHFFTTLCLESGVDIATVAKWRGDRDKGAMLLKNYAHIGDVHGQKQAKKVRFVK